MNNKNLVVICCFIDLESKLSLTAGGAELDSLYNGVMIFVFTCN